MHKSEAVLKIRLTKKTLPNPNKRLAIVIYKQKRTYQLVEFTILADHRVRIKESEKLKVVEYVSDSNTNHIESTRYNPQASRIENEQTRNLQN